MPPFSILGEGAGGRGLFTNRHHPVQLDVRVNHCGKGPVFSPMTNGGLGGFYCSASGVCEFCHNTYLKAH